MCLPHNKTLALAAADFPHHVIPVEPAQEGRLAYGQIQAMHAIRSGPRERRMARGAGAGSVFNVPVIATPLRLTRGVDQLLELVIALN